MELKDLPKNPVEITLKMLDSRWKVLIIRELLEGEKRFNELKYSIKGISQKVLSAKLKELEQDGILSKEVYQQIPLKTCYVLTDIGLSFSPVLSVLKDWGKDYKKYLKLVEKVKN